MWPFYNCVWWTDDISKFSIAEIAMPKKISKPMQFFIYLFFIMESLSLSLFTYW